MDRSPSKTFCAATALAQHQGWLRTVLLARLRDADLVDEVMQEIALAIIHQQSRPETIEHTGPWLYRVALKQILMYRRKTGRRRRFLKALTQQPRSIDPEPKQYDPLQWLLLQERRQSVQQAMECLGDREREILLLKYNDNLTYEQIADRLGISSASVRMRLHRARMQLRDRLAASQEQVPTIAVPVIR